MILFFKSIDNFYSNPANYSMTGRYAFYLCIILYFSLKDCWKYDKSELMNQIFNSKKLRSKYLLEKNAIILTNMFALLCGVSSQEIAKLILNNCVFISLIYLDKFELSDINSSNNLFPSLLQYIFNTSLCIIGICTISVNSLQIDGIFTFIIEPIANLFKYLCASYAITEASIAINFLILFIGSRISHSLKRL